MKGCVRMTIRQPVSIDGIEFDALIEKEESYNSNVPQYPVEDGYTVSDNVTNKPLELSMKLFLTNTPVTYATRHGVSHLRVDDVISRLLKMRDKKDVVKIVTADKTYDDMALTSLTIPKTTKGSREISVSFQKVIKTHTEQTTIPASYGKSGKTGVNAGTAKTKVVNTGSSGGSTLYEWFKPYIGE